MLRTAAENLLEEEQLLADQKSINQLQSSGSQVTVSDILCSPGELRNKLEEEKTERISLENQLDNLRERGGRFDY